MTEMSIESVFGTKAGIVWVALNKNGPSNINDIVKATSMRRELIYGALGWLGRENKISVKMGEGGRGRRAIVSLCSHKNRIIIMMTPQLDYACRFLSIRLFPILTDYLDVALEQLINEKDHNCKYSYSGQEPEDIPKDNDYYDSKN